MCSARPLTHSATGSHRRSSPSQLSPGEDGPTDSTPARFGVVRATRAIKFRSAACTTGSSHSTGERRKRGERAEETERRERERERREERAERGERERGRKRERGRERERRRERAELERGDE